MIPADQGFGTGDAVGAGFGMGTSITPIPLLYRILLGSDLANIGDFANVVMSHTVAVLVPAFTTVGNTVAGDGEGVGVGDGAAFVPYWLNVVETLIFAEFQVFVALFPCKNEYGYQVPFAD